jgi:hypothetical protein
MGQRQMQILLITLIAAATATCGVGATSTVPSVVPSPTRAAPTTDARTPSPSTSPSHSLTPLADCVNPPADITTLIDLQSTGPLDPPGDPVACYGNAPLTFDATWYGVGQADCPTAPEPAWLACSPYSLQPFGDTRKLGAPGLFVAVDPSVSLDVLLTESFPQIRVTGHFDDPAAQTCRETNRVDGAPSLAPAAMTVERCRRVFVITEVVPLQP